MAGKIFKKENIFRYIVFLLIAIGAFAIIRYFITPEPVDTESNKNISIFMQNAIDEINQTLKKGSNDDDMTTRLSWLKSNAALYEEAKENKDEAIQQKSKVLKDLIVKVQTRDFPGLRSAYATSKEEVLSKGNIVIAVSGKMKDTLVFTGPLFAPEKTREEFLKGINQIITDLRFKKVIFKWSEKEGDSKDADIKSKGDPEI